MKTVNLELDLPLVSEALSHMANELAAAKNQKYKLVKFIHGYGSSGVGGEIRIAVQKRLCEMSADNRIGACIFGENWGKSDEHAWKLLNAFPELKQDRDLGRGNRGITVVVL